MKNFKKKKKNNTSRKLLLTSEIKINNLAATDSQLRPEKVQIFLFLKKAKEYK